jgi:Tfp pilus assembly protein PilV
MRSTQAQGVPHARAVPLRPELSAEHGVTLVETLISAAILIVVLFAVLGSLDAASHTAAVNRSRTVAASLAEQALERLRSLPATTLATYDAVAETRVIGKTEYTIQSDAQWVHDASGAPASCDSDGEQADYIRITSTVTSNVVGRRVKPVEMSSLIAPRVGSFGANQGTLAVQVKNELDAPVPNMPVTINGPVAQTDATNVLGCAVFGHIAAGPYDVQLSQPGWVGVSGKQTVTQATQVTPGTKQTVPLRYAQAASVTVNFDTEVRGNKKTATSPSLSAANNALPTGVLVFKPGAPTASITAKDLFPFPDGYTFFSGGCTSQSPDKLLPNYFSSYPGFVKVGAGGSASVTVREPAFNLRITRGPNANSAKPFKNAYVVVTSTDPGCSEKYIFQDVDSNGTLPEPGLPFGNYTVCADDRKEVDPAVNSRRYAKMDLVLSNDPAGLGFDPTPPGDPKVKLWVDEDSATTGYCT